MGYLNSNVPPRVQTALETLEYLRELESGCSFERRPLSSVETSLQNAAVEVLRLYLNCEMDYGDGPPTPPPEEPPAPEAAPVTV